MDEENGSDFEGFLVVHTRIVEHFEEVPVEDVSLRMAQVHIQLMEQNENEITPNNGNEGNFGCLSHAHVSPQAGGKEERDFKYQLKYHDRLPQNPKCIDPFHQPPHDQLRPRHHQLHHLSRHHLPHHPPRYYHRGFPPHPTRHHDPHHPPRHHHRTHPSHPPRHHHPHHPSRHPPLWHHEPNGEILHHFDHPPPHFGHPRLSFDHPLPYHYHN